MGEFTVFYVPREQRQWVGRGRELARALFDAGIHTNHEDGPRWTSEYAARSEPAPRHGTGASYASAGVDDLAERVPVPHVVTDVTCPACGSDVAVALGQSFADLTLTALAPDRPVRCGECDVTTAAKELVFVEPITFARVYLWFSGAEECDWPAAMRMLVESTVGLVDEYWQWNG